MNRILLIFSVCLYFFSCGDPNKKETNKSNSEGELISKKKESDSETREMVQRLNSLVLNGNPMNYYHWNSRQAEALLQRINQNPNNNLNEWFSYVNQLLNSGQTQSCINELEYFLENNSYGYNKNILSDQNRPLIELLALAYLRLGEQVNCQQNHNEFSCIVPFKDKAIHKDKSGSRKAIELYKMLYDKFPTEKYRWLINLGYMTLGMHPDQIATNLLIPFPNNKLEASNFPMFRDVAGPLGVAVNGLSGGVCIDDFNNDGHLDIFTTSYGMSDQVKLFINNGKGGFTDQTKNSGLMGIVSGLNCKHADYDNDGFVDILILRGAWLGKFGKHPNSLLKNLGNGKFVDVTESAGLLSFYPTQTAEWADVNNDGNIDLFIGNEDFGTKEHPSEFYLNNGDGTFTESANAFGLGGINEFVKGVNFGDIDNDNWPDLYISVLGGMNKLYRNVNGNFQDVTSRAGVAEPNFSFPCWFWDVNNDGYQDLFVSGYDTRYLTEVADDYAKELTGKNVESELPRLYINNGDGTFSNMTTEYNLNRTMYSMGSNWGDLDNDGFSDFYVGTGAPDFSTIVPNRMFRNVGGKTFEEVTSSGNFGHIQKGHGVSFADLDRDGDQDIYIVMGGAFEGDVFTNVLYENPINKNNWIVLSLVGTTSNRSAIGADVKLVLDNGLTIYREVGTGGSFGSNSLQLEIGLGSAEVIRKMYVTWPSGHIQEFDKVEVNRKYVMQEGVEKLKQVEYGYVDFSIDSSLHQNHDHH